VGHPGARGHCQCCQHTHVSRDIFLQPIPPPPPQHTHARHTQPYSSPTPGRAPLTPPREPELYRFGCEWRLPTHEQPAVPAVPPLSARPPRVVRGRVRIATPTTTVRQRHRTLSARQHHHPHFHDLIPSPNTLPRPHQFAFTFRQLTVAFRQLTITLRQRRLGIRALPDSYFPFRLHSLKQLGRCIRVTRA
jgi:hypothetical protein